jgi:uncharacterized protein with HEPN domain
MRSDPASARRWLSDIRSQIELGQQFLEGCDYEAFRDDQLRVYAVTRCLEIISEALRRLPDNLKGRHPSILWKRWPEPATSTVAATKLRKWRS